MVGNGVSEVGSGSDPELLIRLGQGGLECRTLLCALVCSLVQQMLPAVGWYMLGLRGESDTALAVSEHMVMGQGHTDAWYRLMRAVMELGAARAQRKPLYKPGVGVGGNRGIRMLLMMKRKPNSELAQKSRVLYWPMLLKWSGGSMEIRYGLIRVWQFPAFSMNLRSSVGSKLAATSSSYMAVWGETSPVVLS